LLNGRRDQIRFWNLTLSSHNACTRILPNKGFCRAIILLSNDEIACGSQANINIFRLDSGRMPLKKLIGHNMLIFDLLLHNDRQSLLSCSLDLTMRMWNFQKGSCIKIFKTSFCNKVVKFNEKIIATAVSDGIKFWNVYTGKCEKELKDQKRIYGLAIDHEGVLVSYGFEETLFVWS